MDLNQNPIRPRADGNLRSVYNRTFSRYWNSTFGIAGRPDRVKQYRSQIRKLTNVHNVDAAERCKIGAALPPQESAAPTESPSPEHPDEVGADIIEDELWPTLGSKTASRILSAALLL